MTLLKDCLKIIFEPLHDKNNKVKRRGPVRQPRRPRVTRRQEDFLFLNSMDENYTKKKYISVPHTIDSHQFFMMTYLKMISLGSKPPTSP